MKTKITFFKKKMLLAMLLFPTIGIYAQVYEAESFSSSQYVSENESEYFSGGKSIGLLAAQGAYAEYNISVANEGTYDIVVYYSTMQERSFCIVVNSQIPTVIKIDSINETGSWDGSDVTDDNNNIIAGIKTANAKIYLKAGENTLKLSAFDLPTMGFSPNIDKFTITPSETQISEPQNAPSPLKLEAENADVIYNGTTENVDCYSGGKGVTNLSESKGSKIIFNKIDVDETGTYDLTVHYTSATSRELYAKVNGRAKTEINCLYSTSAWLCPETPSETQPAIYKKTVQIYLESGIHNSLVIGAFNGWGPNVDYIEISKSTLTVEPGEYEPDAWSFDYTDIAESVSEDHVTSKNNLEALLDNNEYTDYVVPNATSAKVVVKLPYPIIPTGYAIACSANDDPEILDQWQLEYSTDSVNWYSVESSLISTTLNYRKVRTMYTPNDQIILSAKYFRLTATGEESVKISELQLFGLPYVSAEQNFPNDDLTYDITSYADISNYATADPDGFNRGGTWNEVFENVFDKSIFTKYTVVGSKTFVIQYEPSDALHLKSYALTVHYTTNYSSRNPRNWILEGYDAQLGDWKVLDSRKNIIFPEYGSTMMFNMQDTTALCYVYKLTVTDNSGADDTHLCQWQMFKDEIKGPFYTDNTTKVSTYTKDNLITVSGGKGNINIHSDENHSVTYSIYNTVGQKISVGACIQGTNTISLSKGIYIVKAGSIISKVVVQ